MKLILIFLLLFQFGNAALFNSLSTKKYKQVEKKFGKKSLRRIKYLQNELQKIEKEKFLYTKIHKVNKLFNKLKYKKNKQHWQGNYQPSLLEFSASGFGNSYDFASAKYNALVSLGLDKSRFSFFKTSTSGLNKMKYDTDGYYVLGYYPKSKGEYVILDCYVDTVIPIGVKDKKYQKITMSNRDRLALLTNKFDLKYSKKSNKIDLYDGKSLAQKLNLVAEKKAIKQWMRIFSKERLLSRYQIDKLNKKQQKILAKYLVSNAADSDRSQMAGGKF